MPQSEFDEAILIYLSKLNRYEVANWIHIQTKPYGTKAADRALDIIRQLQIALSNYSRRRKFDQVQLRMLGILTKIEKWVRLEYMRVKTEEVIKDHPEWATNPTIVKQTVLTNWENYFKSRCY